LILLLVLFVRFFALCTLPLQC